MNPMAAQARRGGFTLVEILASLLFLAIAVPAIVGALGLASRTSEVAERGSLAGSLAENKLNEMLLDNAWQSVAQSNGDCGADFPYYHWQMSTQTWTGLNNTGTGTGATSTNTSTGSTGISGLTELSIEVFYPVQGSEHSVRLTTLVNTSSTTSGTTTTTGTSSSSTTR